MSQVTAEKVGNKKMKILQLFFLVFAFISVRGDVPVSNTLIRSEFIEKFVVQGKSVLIPGLLGDMLGGLGLDLTSTKCVNSGEAAVTLIGEQTLRNLLLQGTAFQSTIQKNLKTRIAIPDIMKCDPLLEKLLHKTSHLYGVNVQEDGSEDFHRLVCLVEGEQKMLLEKEKENEEVKLSGRDCLYVPVGWRLKSSDVGHFLAIWWQNDESQDYCSSELNIKSTLADKKWTGEDILKVIEKTTDRKREAIDFLIHMIDNYFGLKADTSLNVDDFTKRVSKDKYLTPNLPVWNDECADVAKEFFGILDRNKDEVIDKKDLEGLENADIDLWAGLTQDRIQDLADIIFDMRVDMAGSLPPNPNIPSAEEFIERSEKFYENQKKKKEEKKARKKDEL